MKKRKKIEYIAFFSAQRGAEKMCAIRFAKYPLNILYVYESNQHFLILVEPPTSN